jgi:hypothetical protein
MPKNRVDNGRKTLVCRSLGNNFLVVTIQVLSLYTASPAKSGNPNTNGVPSMKALRFAIVLLVAAAGFASATAPKQSIEKGRVLSQGSSPIPWCPGACPDVPAAQ